MQILDSEYFIAAAAYLIGSVPFAVIIGYFAGIDIRNLGSGNPGATNMARQGGRKLGALTLALDVVKGAIAVVIGKHFGYPVAAALWVVVGHCFSIFLKFRGGKGVATTLGALLAVYPATGGLFIIFWLITYLIFKISSISALTAVWLTCLSAYFFWYPDIFFLTLFFAVLITIRHHSNIKKLINGNET